MARDHLSHLARPCKPIKAHGSRVLKALRDGQLPLGVSHWPDDPIIRPEVEALMGLRRQLNEIETSQSLGATAMHGPSSSEEDGGYQTQLLTSLALSLRTRLTRFVGRLRT